MMDPIVNNQIGELQGQILRVSRLGILTDRRYLELKADHNILVDMVRILSDKVEDLKRQVNTHIGNDFREPADKPLVPDVSETPAFESMEDIRNKNLAPPHQCFTCQQYHECFSGMNSECIFSK